MNRRGWLATMFAGLIASLLSWLPKAPAAPALEQKPEPTEKDIALSQLREQLDAIYKFAKGKEIPTIDKAAKEVFTLWLRLIKEEYQLQPEPIRAPKEKE